MKECFFNGSTKQHWELSAKLKEIFREKKREKGYVYDEGCSMQYIYTHEWQKKAVPTTGL